MSAQKEPKKPTARAKAGATKPKNPQHKELSPEIERELRESMMKAWELTYARHQREREEATKAAA